MDQVIFDKTGKFLSELFTGENHNIGTVYRSEGEGGVREAAMAVFGDKWHGKPSIRSSKRSGSAHHAPNKERTDDSRSLENQRWRLSWQGGPNEQVARAATD